jgi:hypothetical protein
MIRLTVRTQFDKRKLKKKVETATFTSLSEGGGAVRKTAKRSIRKPKKASSPGRAHEVDGVTNPNLLPHPDWSGKKNQRKNAIFPADHCGDAESALINFGFAVETLNKLPEIRSVLENWFETDDDVHAYSS